MLLSELEFKPWQDRGCPRCIVQCDDSYQIDIWMFRGMYYIYFERPGAITEDSAKSLAKWTELKPLAAQAVLYSLLGGDYRNGEEREAS
jgi:hypothetical protein